MHWSRPNVAAGDPKDAQVFLDAALADAKAFKAAFEEDVQFVLERVQHHWHKLQDGKRIPLNYCALKAKGKKHLCRADFPLVRRCKEKAVVVCPCVAKKHQLKIRGRKNMLGTVSSRRRCPWLSGTCSSLAAMLRSNTHIQPNFRIPLSASTTECQGSCLQGDSSRDEAGDMLRLITITQRAMKQMTGYFTGYISKRQSLGNFELKAASSALPFLCQKVKAMQSASAQLAHLTNRLICTLEGKGILRSAPESFNLCGKGLRTRRRRDYMI